LTHAGEYFTADKHKLPIRWSSPEVLKGKPATSKSDVWSFGVVLCEIVADGKVPFAKLTNQEVFDLVAVRGQHMELPSEERVPKGLTELIARCFKSDPKDRPSFVEIVTTLQQIKQSTFDTSINEKTIVPESTVREPNQSYDLSPYETAKDTSSNYQTTIPETFFAKEFKSNQLDGTNE